MKTGRFISLLLFSVVLTGCQLGVSAPSVAQSDTPAQPILAVEAEPVVAGEAGKQEEEGPVLRVGDLLAAAKAETPADTAELLTEVAEAPTAEAAPAAPVETELGESVEAAAPEPEAASASSVDGPAFEIGNELTIAALRATAITGSEITVEQTLGNGANYSQYIASYLSEGNRIYGLLTVPLGDVPAGGFKAVVFNHGYIPPNIYQTTERYVAYVDALARSGLVVFKIDLRGHGNSEGEPGGSYFSPNYTVDAISALKSLQTLEYVNPQGIGMWGHSMAGNLVLRAALVEADVKAVVIWAGAVYSYDDLVRYAISDPSFNRDVVLETPSYRRRQEIRATYGEPNTAVPYWKAVSLTENLTYLQAPVQLHHAVNDDVVTIGYSIDLDAILTANNKPHEFYSYEGGGHNIGAPYFTDAMQRTIAFFLANL